MRKSEGKEQKKELFYDFFKIGLEVEGEFVDRTLRANPPRDCRVVDDGSLRAMNGGYTFEIVGNILQSKEDETAFVNSFKEAELVVEEGRRQFAFQNKTAGTHLHFSFADKLKSELPALRGENKDLYLYLFDSVEFERYFFKKYFRKFRLSKFLERLKNSYCKPFVERLITEEVNTIQQADSVLARESDLFQIESIKGSGNRGRYRWLNNECLSEGQGLEIRVFPYLITAKGLSEVIEFAQDVLLSYYLKPKTQRKIAKLIEFFDIKDKYLVNIEKLKKYDRVLFNSLLGQRRNNNLSMDFVEFYLYIHKKNKKAFIERVS